MGQAAHQHLAGFLLGQLGLFLGDAQQSVAGVNLEQQQGVAIAENRRYGVIHCKGLAGERGQHGLALGKRVGLLNSLAQ